MATPSLLARWSATAVALASGADPDLVAAQGESLLQRWAQPHRRYHDLSHLTEVLDGVDTLAAHAADVEAVRAAAWFHDAVYVGRPGQDEQDSAALARAVLGALGADPTRVDVVERLVLLTVTHDPAPGDDDGEVLCDADLAVLARGVDGYQRYAAAIRQEYAHVPEPAFRAGRAAVLRGLLDHERLYRTPTARVAWEDAARANLAAELAVLEG